jgi:hypothetical protein
LALDCPSPNGLPVGQLADARQLVRQVALAAAEVHRGEERHGQRQRQEEDPSKAALLSLRTCRRASDECDHFSRPFDSLRTDVALAIEVRADLASLGFFCHADRVELVMVAQFAAVHAVTTASNFARAGFRARLIVYSRRERNQDFACAAISSRRDATNATRKRSNPALDAFFS